MQPQTFVESLHAAQEHHESGRLPQAVELYRRASELNPADSLCLFLLGLATFQLGDDAEAANLVRRAIAIDPTVPEYHCDLGRILFQLKDLDGAISASSRAIALRPEFPQAEVNLGHALCRSGCLTEAIHAYRRAIALGAESDDLLNNLGMALFEVGRIDGAVECFDRILASNPRDASAHSNRVYALHFHPLMDGAAIQEELLRWNARHASPLKRHIQPLLEDRDPGRRLRIGYVSGDFRDHVVGWNMLPILAEHDRRRFQIFCYSNVVSSDATTAALRSKAESWRDISNESDEQAADLIRADRIDILVDLSLHTGGNRLLVFARKPAPVQVTYLAYPGSSGLETMDYRLSDPFLDMDEDLARYAERTISLPRTYWCYNPGGPTPAVGPLPAIERGTVTFGCLNAFKKISRPTIQLWAQLLRDVPTSRILLSAPIGECRAEALEVFESSGVSAHRIEFITRRPWAQYIAAYQAIDVALDPFPYGGGITTCDAIWMGVPVVTLRGNTSVGRAATSILSILKLPQFVAISTDGYIRAAKEAAQDLSRLSQLRSQLRQRLLESSLMDSAEFVRGLERTLLKMWHSRGNAHPA